MLTIADDPDHFDAPLTPRIRPGVEAEHGHGGTPRPVRHLSEGFHSKGGESRNRHGKLGGRNGAGVGRGECDRNDGRLTRDDGRPMSDRERRQTSRKRRTAKAEPTTPTTTPTTATRMQVPATSHPPRDIWAMMLPWLAAVLVVSRPMP